MAAMFEILQKAWVLGGAGYRFLAIITFLSLILFTAWTFLLNASQVSKENLRPSFPVQQIHSGPGDNIGRDKIVFNQLPVEQESVSLRVKYELSPLPIELVPNKTAYVLQLNPRIKKWAFEITTSETDEKWPSDMKSKIPAPESGVLCTLFNHGDKDFIGVSISFKVDFFNVEKAPVSVKQNSDGTLAASFHNDGIFSYILKTGNKFERFKRGALVNSYERKMVIPSIKAHSEERFYIINQSKHIVGFLYPLTASGTIAGNSKEAQIQLLRPETSAQDALPGFQLPPTRYSWKGIPQH